MLSFIRREAIFSHSYRTGRWCFLRGREQVQALELCVSFHSLLNKVGLKSAIETNSEGTLKHDYLEFADIRFTQSIVE